MQDGFAIRRARRDDAARIARIHVAATRAAYGHIYSPEYLNGLSIEDVAYRRIEQDRGHLALGDPFAVFVAFDKDLMIGFADVGPTTKSGVAELCAIYLDPDYIGTGAGRALLRSCIDHACRSGFKAMIATVLVKNSLARSFYERSGARALVETETVIETGGSKESVICYLWDDLKRTN